MFWVLSWQRQTVGGELPSVVAAVAFWGVGVPRRSHRPHRCDAFGDGAHGDENRGDLDHGTDLLGGFPVE